jgi:hypothetical protein
MKIPDIAPTENNTRQTAWKNLAKATKTLTAPLTSDIVYIEGTKWMCSIKLK